MGEPQGRVPIIRGRPGIFKMDYLTKLSLLRAATATPFTTKSALLVHLRDKFAPLSVEEIEGFFEGIVDFEAITETTELTETTAIGNVTNTNSSETTESNEPVPSEPVTVTVSRSTSPSPSPSQAHSQSPSPSPSLVVPVKTPSGRTLRSASTVNTAEPRRLRNSSISQNISNKQ